MAIYFPADVKLASRYVKQAIALMMKYGIAPNPCNYTLWFTYVTNRDQELNKALDQILAEKKGFSEEVCHRLFKQFVMKEDINMQEGLQASLKSVLHELMVGVGEAKGGADDFQRSLEESLVSISGDSTGASLKGTVNLLIQAAQTVKFSANSFQAQLESAENEIAELRRLLRENDRHAYIDSLTQVGNRRAFDKRMTELFVKEKSRAALVLIDLDHFKQLNDTYGHVIGDKALQMVAQILQKVCPDNGLVARYGGEEFALLLEDSQEAAYQTAEAVQIAMRDIKMKRKSSGEVINKLTASFGVAEKLEGEFPDEFIERADDALYSAKAKGRDRIEAAD